MKVFVHSVFDHKARLWSHPFYAVNSAVALRSFRAMCNEPGNQVYQAPRDFSLFVLGTFDDDVGKFTLLEQAVKLADGGELVDVDPRQSALNLGGAAS